MSNNNLKLRTNLKMIKDLINLRVLLKGFNRLKLNKLSCNKIKTIIYNQNLTIFTCSNKI